MCKFFSFVGDGYGNFLYSDWETRERRIKYKSEYNPDSHTWILTAHNIPPRLQDRWSKYEYNPLTKEFLVDEGVKSHDHESARNWAEGLDYKKIVPALVIKPIVNPLEGRKKKITEKEKALLKEWASVWASVRDSVGDSVWTSVRDSVWDSVWASVRDSVGDSVWASVRDSVWDSVWASVGASVGDSVRASVWAYISSFFNITYQHNFSSLTKLWEAGFVPSFNGTNWRLHSGKKAEWEIVKI